MRLGEALARPALRLRAGRALALGPLCDHCLGRLFAEVDTGLANADRGRAVREAVGAGPPDGACGLCADLFLALDAWTDRAVRALVGWEFATFAVASHPDPAVVAREERLWAEVGGDLAEPHKQAFNRLLGIRLCQAVGRETDLRDPDVTVVADHAAGRADLDVKPLFLRGAYRKLVRGLPQCRWRTWPASVQQVIAEPLRRAAQGEDDFFHGCGREDTDVRCLAPRPFILEVRRPRRRRLDWSALADEIARSGRVEVSGLEPCGREEVARLKALRPEKTYRAVVRLAADVDEAALGRLAGLAGLVRQRTPVRVLRRRSDLVRRRQVRAVTWRRLDPRTVELEVRAQAGTYIKELISGDGGRTRPSVAEVLGVPAECAELDVVAFHA